MLQDYRARVSADHEVTELRELQKAQGQLGMQQPSLSMQASMAVNPASMGQPLAPSMSMDASGYVLLSELFRVRSELLV